MREKWVWGALLCAAILIVAQLLFGVRITAEQQGIPLLAALFMNELGFIASVIGLGFVIKLLMLNRKQYKLYLASLLLTISAIGFVARLLTLFPLI